MGTKETALQNKQYLYLDKLAEREMHESVAVVRDIVCKCNTCHRKTTLHTADGARRFLSDHEGHYTWFEVGNKYENAPKGGF